MIKKDRNQWIIEMGRGDMILVDGVYTESQTGMRMAMVGLSNSHELHVSGEPCADKDVRPIDQDLVLIWYDTESLERLVEVLQRLAKEL